MIFNFILQIIQMLMILKNCIHKMSKWCRENMTLNIFKCKIITSLEPEIWKFSYILFIICASKGVNEMKDLVVYFD